MSRSKIRLNPKALKYTLTPKSIQSLNFDISHIDILTQGNNDLFFMSKFLELFKKLD
jgi:hypothetical protein